MALYCPVTGVKILSNPKWIDQKVSNTFTANFLIINGSVIYSLPKGHADLDGVRQSLALNDKVANLVSEGGGPYVQIEDYNFLTGSSSAARRYFINRMNEDKRILKLLFCNLSLPFSIAVKIGQRFDTAGKHIQVVKNYSDAIKQAMAFSSQDDLRPYLAPIDLSGCAIEKEGCLSPVELLSDDAWNIRTPDYSNRAVIIDQCILHSTSKGYLEPSHVALIDRTRSLCQSAISKEAKIQYIVIDASKLKGGSPMARKKYMQSLSSWHQRFPFRMYIAYGANTFMRTALHLAKPVMPFKVKVVKNITHAFNLIHKDKNRNSSKQAAAIGYEKPTVINQKDISSIMAFIGGINWEEKGINKVFDIEEKHPFFYLYQSIKLIKEELDTLFAERRQAENRIAASLIEKDVLLREIHHRVKNNMQSIISMLRLHSRRTSDKRLRQIFDECRDRINAMSLIHETLYQSEDMARIDFKTYLKKLCRSLSQAHGASDKGIKVSVARCDVSPNMDQSIAVGMVICELVANAFQHAFPSNCGGQVSISLSAINEEQFELSVSDNGKGLPANFDIFNSPSLGLKLAVATVTRELNGTIRTEQNGGTRFIICFKCKQS